MISQTAVFTRVVRDHMDSAVVVRPTTACGEVVTKLCASAASAAVIAAANGQPQGILTEQDISRRVAFQIEPDTPVSAVMSAPVQTISGDDFLHHAIARMRRDDIRHLPVTDAAGQVVGLLELHQVLARVSGQTVAHIELLDHEYSLAGMHAAKRNQATIARQLLHDEVPAPEIQQLLTRLNHELYRAVVAFCLDDMKVDWGEPPVPFEVIVMGSGGRGENYLTPDQDNGFIIADYPNADHTRIDRWFIELSERMTAALNEIGFEYCHGHVMATNPLWRKTLSQWQAQIDGWIRRSDGQVLRLSDIFFDFICVFGRGEMTAVLRDHITHNAARPFFLREIFKVDEDHDVALGPFGWLLTERQKSPHKGKLNLKITGTLPLVGAVRLMALRHQVAATATLDRIQALYEKDVLSHNEEDYLSNAYRHITYLLMRQQLDDVEAGAEPGNHVAPKTLSKREKELLVAGFKAIRAFRSRLRTDLTGEIF